MSADRKPIQEGATPAGTSEQILDIAQALVQRRGYNGFSYADIADALEVTKASLHYHYRTKADLGLALVQRYSETFQRALKAIDASGASPPDRLRRYVEIYAGVLADDRICLCGMLAAEYETLPKPMRGALLRFFDLNEAWLAGVLTQGREEGVLRYGGEPAEAAELVVATLQGSMILARPKGAQNHFRALSRRLLAELGA